MSSILIGFIVPYVRNALLPQLPLGQAELSICMNLDFFLESTSTIGGQGVE
jgi:hypothetical protein